MPPNINGDKLVMKKSNSVVVDVNYGKSAFSRLGKALLGIVFVSAKHSADALENVVEKYK